MTSTHERLKIKAQKLRLEKLKAQAQEDAYYKKMTTGLNWTIFTILTFFCLILNILITIDTFVDTNKLEPVESYSFDRSIYAIGYQSVVIDGNLFMPAIQDLAGFEASSFKVEISPIFRIPKYFHFDKIDTYSAAEPFKVHHRVLQEQSIYNYFPYLQIALILPLLVFLFKEQEPWFKFSRLACLLLIFPGSLLILFNIYF